MEETTGISENDFVCPEEEWSEAHEFFLNVTPLVDLLTGLKGSSNFNYINYVWSRVFEPSEDATEDDESLAAKSVLDPLMLARLATDSVNPAVRAFAVLHPRCPQEIKTAQEAKWNAIVDETIEFGTGTEPFAQVKFGKFDRKLGYTPRGREFSHLVALTRDRLKVITFEDDDPRPVFRADYLGPENTTNLRGLILDSLVDYEYPTAVTMYTGREITIDFDGRVRLFNPDARLIDETDCFDLWLDERLEREYLEQEAWELDFESED